VGPYTVARRLTPDLSGGTRFLSLRGRETQALKLATNLGELRLDLKSLPITDSSEQAELFAQQLLHIE
jgi:hypothetical protein